MPPPCPSVVADAETEDAKRWLSESLGSILVDREGDVETVRLVLDLRKFDGWSDLSALGNHLSLVREHYRVPERIAIVIDKAWQNMAGKIMARFVNARTMFFDSDDYEGAVAWIGP